MLRSSWRAAEIDQAASGAFFGKILITKICAPYFETQQIVC